MNQILYGLGVTGAIILLSAIIAWITQKSNVKYNRGERRMTMTDALLFVVIFELIWIGYRIP